MGLKNWLNNPETPRKIINTVKSLGFVGGAVSLLYGIIFVVCGFELWLLLPESTFRSLLEVHAQNEKVYIGLFLIATGLTVLLDHSGIRMSILLRNINKAEKRGHIKTSSANAAKDIVLSRRICADINMFDNHFAQFIKWSQERKNLEPNCLKATQKAWKIFRNLPPESHIRSERPKE